MYIRMFEILYYYVLIIVFTHYNKYYIFTYFYAERSTIPRSESEYHKITFAS